MQTPTLPSPSRALKRALRDTDINCLSPKRKAKLAKAGQSEAANGDADFASKREDVKERRQRSSSGLVAAVGCLSGKASLLKRKKGRVESDKQVCYILVLVALYGPGSSYCRDSPPPYLYNCAFLSGQKT